MMSYVKNNECKWYKVCPMNQFYAEGRIAGRWIKEYCMGDFRCCVRYKMEENGEYHPDWMLPDGTIEDSLK